MHVSSGLVYLNGLETKPQWRSAPDRVAILQKLEMN